MSTCNAISALESDWEVYGVLFLGQLPQSVYRVVKTQEPEFAKRCDFETTRVFSIEPDINMADSEFFLAAREVLATNKEHSIQDVFGKDVAIDLHVEGQIIIVKWSDVEGVSHQVPIPDLTLLSPNQEIRLKALRNIIHRLGPTAKDFRGLLEEIGSRELSHQELSAILDESANGVAAKQANLTQKIKHGFSIALTDLMPQEVSYFEQLSGPKPIMQEPEAYFKETLLPYRKYLLSRDLRAGLDICCLGALRDDLTPGQWVVDIDNDTLWDALNSFSTETNPFSLLGALDIALYRLDDLRFREFSEEAIINLLDVNLGQNNSLDIYKLLQIFFNFILNRINLLETGANNPGYWKRMCALMQAGLIVKDMSEYSPIDVDAIERWTRSNMVSAGDYALLVDARKEPMLLSNLVSPQALRFEILGRLQALKSRHEREGHQIPRANDINQAFTQAEARGESLVWFLPGPLEGHKRPKELIPNEVVEKHLETGTDGTELLLIQQLAAFAQLFALSEVELERAREVVMTTMENIPNADLHENLKVLEFAGTIAATNRDTILADVIADAVVKAAPKISEEKDIQVILRIILQSATAHEEHDVWFKWLDEKLVGIASHLPPPPHKCLRKFVNHLDELGRILPVDLWFHIRARTIASAGAG